jgi:outer membrane protein OmpA-like peptidoglycan-associated protein/tetratricopeptide (TPR) repeat protein
MKKYLSAALFCLLVLGSQALHAQLNRANKAYDRKAFATAIPLYQRHLEKVPTSEEGMEKLAHSYRMVNNSREAEYWYNRLIKAGNKDPQNVFYYAQMLINNEKWDDAVPLLEKYLQERDWDEVAQNMLRSARDYKSFMADSTMYIVKSTNINTAKSEFGPTMYRNSLVFTSSRTPTKSIFKWTGDSFLDLYQAQYFGKAELGEPIMLPGVANSKYHEGGSTFSPDGNTMYFTRNDYNEGKLKKGENGLVRLKTFQAQLVRNKWENVSEVSFNGKEYSVGHPCVSPDGNTFYFVSDMTGGEGGTDIWYSRKQGEEWGKPENMGPRVNTPGNDMFPWISPTGVFYFASTGHPGLGGLDIFRVTSMGTEFEKVANVGYPVNSPQDDFSLAIDEKTGVGFFSSNRKGGKGDDDIYSFIQRQIMEGLVLDKQTGEPIANAKVEIYGVKGLATIVRTNEVGQFRYGLDRNTDYKLVASKDLYLESTEMVSTVSFDPSVPVEALLRLDKDNSTPIYTLNGQVEGDSITDLEGTTVRIIAKEVIVKVDANGNFTYHLAPETDYEVRVEKEGYLDKVMDVTTKGLEPGDLSLNAMLMRLMPDTALYRIFYDYNDAYVRPDAYRELDRVLEFLKRNPTSKIRLVSHADPRGTASYNEQLSKNRTNSAFTYLMQHGIAKDRLEQVWLGERAPKNKCRDGVDCTEEEYQQNRQTEIQYGGKVKQNELPKLEATSMDEPAKTGKDAIKADAPKSGKDEIKLNMKMEGKDSIKNGPAPTTTPAPEAAKTVAPAPATTPAPEAAKTVAPAPAKTPAPEAAKTVAPAPAKTPAPEAAKTVASAGDTPPTSGDQPLPEKTMVEELKKSENMVQDLDKKAPKGGDAIPADKAALDGKPK